MNRFHFAARTALIALFALAIAACGAGPTPTQTPIPTLTPLPTEAVTPTPPPTPTLIASLPQVDPAQRSTIRFFLASTGEALDVYLEGAIQAANLRPGLISNTVTPPAGRYALIVRPARQTDAAPILNTTITLTAGESVIFVLRQTPDGLTALRYLEDLRTTENGAARVSLINAVIGTFSGSAFLNDAPLGASTAGGQPTPPQEVRPGVAALRLTAGGATAFEERLSFQARQAYSLILWGEVGGRLQVAQAISPTRRETRIRLVNAYPRERALDVSFGERRIAQALAFGAASQYAAYPSGTYTLRLTVPGVVVDPVLEQDVRLPEDAQGLLAFYVFTGADGQDTLRAGFFPEDSSPIPAGQSRLTLVNLVFQQRPAIQPYNPTTPINGFDPIPYGQASPAVALPAGRLNLAVNTVNAARQNTIEQLEGLELRPNISYTFVVLGRPGVRILFETDLSAAAAAAITPTPTDAVRVRLIHALIGVGAVDLIIGGEVVAEDVTYGGASAFVPIANAIRPAQLVRAGTKDLIAQTALRLAPRGSLTFLAIGTAAQPQLLQADERQFPTGSTAVIRFIHAAPGSGPISISSTSTISGTRPSNPNAPTPTPSVRVSNYVSRLPFPDISRPVSLREGEYTLEAKDSATGSLLGQLTFTAKVGNRYDVLIVPGDGGGLRLLLIGG